MFILLVCFLLHQSAFATADSSQDLKSKALQELQKPPRTHSAAAAEAPGTGVLQLKDPNPEIERRRWHYFLQLSAQAFQPKGSLSNGLTASHFELESSGATVMPALELGFQAPFELGGWRWLWGLAGRAGFADQKTSAVFDNGYRDTDVHLDTTLLSLCPFLSLRIPGAERFTFTLGVESGLVDYSQASSDALADVNSHSTFSGYSAGGEFRILDSWSVLLNYAHRGLSQAQEEIALQKDSFELGTKFLW